jgi:hypothetical protein
MENPCHHRLPPSQSSSFALSSYSQLGARLSDLGQQQQGTVSSLPKTERQPQQQPLSFLGRRSDLAAMDSAASAKQEKEECQTLRPFFDDEWPRARASSWPGIPGGNASFPSATAQLSSMSTSTPIASSEFPVASSQAPVERLS